MRDAQSEEVAVTRVSEGESGVKQGRFTEERVQILAEYWGLPANKRAELPISRIATYSGLSSASVRVGQRDPRVLKKIVSEFEVEAVYDWIEARQFLRGVIQAVKEGKAPISEGVKAARTFGEVQGALKKGGTQVSLVNQNITPTAFMEMSDDELNDRVDQILRQRGVDPGED